MGEIQKTNRKLCTTCKYFRKDVGHMSFCTYYLETKQRRGCPIGWCDKYEPRTKRKRVRMKAHGCGCVVEEK